jgi:hypothetical protein
MTGASLTRDPVHCALCGSTGIWSCGTGCPLPHATDRYVVIAVTPAKETPRPRESLLEVAWRFLIRDQDTESISPRRGKGPGDPAKRVRYRDKWTTRACSLASRWAVMA